MRPGESMQQTTGRLPVNPRRHKVAPENRKRVARACNSCNVRRIKCSGERPCLQCTSGERECIYPSVETNKNAVLKDENERLKRRLAALEQGLQIAVPDDIERQELIQQVENADTPARSSSVGSGISCAPDEADAATEGRMLYDFSGNFRFFGETSGATFLDLLKHFMLTLVPLAFVPGPGHTAVEDGSTFVASIGHYRTEISTPLLSHDLEVDPLWLPSRTDMTLMLTALSYHIQHGNGDYVSGGIYYWGDMSSVPSAITLSPSHADDIKSGKYRHLAFYNICFAFAKHVLNHAPNPDEENAGDRYFRRAQLLLGNPHDAVRFNLRDIPALALMGFYLVEIDRRDSAYMFVSLAIHVAIVHGSYRHCADESSKRMFWTLYILDRWLSCLMGRPPTLIDESIRIPLPADAPNMPPADGLRAHVEFCRISGFIVGETFKIAPRNQHPSLLSTKINQALWKLRKWRRELPASLQLDPEKYSVDPGACTLHMAYNQLTLLTTRPIFFNAVKRSVAERYIQSGWTLESDPNYTLIHTCSSAAYANICIFRFISHIHKRHRGLQASLHIVFNAAVILMLNRILRACTSAVDPEIQFAMTLFSTESQTGSKYQRDCLQVLKDLKVIVERFLMTAKGGLNSFQQGLMAQREVGVLHPTATYESGNANVVPMNVARIGQGPAGGTGEVYQELVTWTQMDNSQLHDTFKI